MGVVSAGREFKDSYDVVVLGAGAGGMTSAAVAAREGLDTLVLEKTEFVGGTTSFAGGMAWAPNNPKKTEVESDDTLDAVQTYLDATAGTGPGSPLRRAFLETVPEAIGYLDRNTEVKLTPLSFYPDYYPDAPCSTTRGRIMEPFPFDARELGEDFKALRPPLLEFTLFGGMMIARSDIVHFRNMFRAPRSMLRVIRLTLTYALQRLSHHRGTSLVLGNALAGRLLRSLQVLKVPIRVKTKVLRLVTEGARVVGVEVETTTGRSTIRARQGVVLATGGFPHDAGMRRKYLPQEASPYSATSNGSTGDGLTLGQQAGGVVPGDDGNDGYWSPVSRFKRADGSEGIYPHTVTDRGKPGFLAVNLDGRRFTNEANSYHDFVKGMFRLSGNRPSTPAYLICDSASLWQYGLGAVKPMHSGLRAHLKSGYVKRAGSLSDLAAQLGVDAGTLEETVAIYNKDAERGVDSLFGRGSNAYHRYMGDPENEPNPCMRPMTKPPFYAVEIHAGTLGTAAGLRTNVHGQVLNSNGSPIGGLYACGNDMNSIMDGSYPGPGITLGPALVFGYIVGMHLAHGDREEIRKETA